MKRFSVFLMAAILVFTLPWSTKAKAATTVCLSPQSLTVDEKAADCKGYNIDGANYFKLRDIAYLLNGSGSQFSVGWDGSTVTVKTGEAYATAGGELEHGSDLSSTAVLSGAALQIDGTALTGITAYNIGGNTYFKLRDLGDALGFVVDFDSASNAAIVHSTKTVKVSTATEFINAVAPNTRVVLAAGTYDLSTVDKAAVTNTCVSYSEVYDGEEIVFSGVDGLTISGTGTDTTSILVEPRYAYVLNFSDSANVTVKNLTAGHTTAQGYCTGGVLHFYGGTTNVSVNSCELFGCGTYGVRMEDASGLRMTNTVIRNCTYGVVSAYNSSDMTFDDCSFHDCEEFSMIDLSDCSDVVFSGCKITNNTVGSEWSSFISLNKCSSVAFAGCSITKNSMYSFVNLYGCTDVVFTDNTIEDNTITTGVYADGSEKNATFSPEIS